MGPVLGQVAQEQGDGLRVLFVVDAFGVGGVEILDRGAGGLVGLRGRPSVDPGGHGTGKAGFEEAGTIVRRVDVLENDVGRDHPRQDPALVRHVDGSSFHSSSRGTLIAPSRRVLAPVCPIRMLTAFFAALIARDLSDGPP